jgi:hypothetical protein
MKAERRVMLKTKPAGSEMDGYVFVDDHHARQWLLQKFITEERYEVAIVNAKTRACCGELYAIKEVTRMSVSEFLQGGN